MSQLAADLNRRVLEARDAYYNGNPIMSDGEYDALEAELRGLLQTHPELASVATALQKVGSEANLQGRVRHIRPMLSIENMYTTEDVLAWYDGLLKTLPATQVTIAIEPKFDGISCELRYRDHKLTQALTRGVGDAGEDMTPQVLACPDIPKELPSQWPDNLNVRGELVMTSGSLKRLNEELLAKGKPLYSSARNLAAGTMKQKDVKEVAKRGVFLRPWDLYGENDLRLPVTHALRMFMLQQAGFPAYVGFLASNRDEILGRMEQLQALREGMIKNELGLETDGIVFKVNNLEEQRTLGVNRTTTNYQICWKSQNAALPTILREIIWQMGRTGKLTPVAVCDPVVLAGATVTRANLNNITYIRNMGITLGAKVEILRSGDVIPVITRVLEGTDRPVVVPTLCPECHKLLVTRLDDTSKIETSECQNPVCPARVRDHFAYIADRSILEIEGLGPELANRLAKHEQGARTVADLVEFCNDAQKFIALRGEATFASDMMKAGFPSGAAVVKMARSMETAKKASWERWIAALGIPKVSTSMGADLAKTLRLKETDMAGLPLLLKNLPDMPGIGSTKRAVLVRWASDPHNVNECLRLHKAGVRPTPLVVEDTTGAAPLKGLTFCITGTFSEDRDAITCKLVKLGAEAKSGVSKRTQLLITGKNAGGTKLTDAAKHNVKQVGEEWLAETLEKYGETLVGYAKSTAEDV